MDLIDLIISIINIVVVSILIPLVVYVHKKRVSDREKAIEQQKKICKKFDLLLSIERDTNSKLTKSQRDKINK
jgi:hypothetical protein